MSKLYIGLIAVCMISTSAFALNYGRVSLGTALCGKGESRLTAEKTALIKQRDFSLDKLKTGNKGTTLKVSRSEADDPIITETPEGTLYKNAYGGGHNYYVFYGSQYSGYTDGNAMDLVDDGKYIYIKNPFSMAVTNSWLKGQKVASSSAGSPDTIVVSLPQRMKETEDYYGNKTSYFAQSFYYTKDEEGNEDYGPNEKQEIRFTWDGDTLRKIGKDMLALTDQTGNWSGYGDDSITIFRQKDIPTAVPENAGEPVKYTLRYKKDDAKWRGAYVRVIKDGNDIYIGDLYEGADFWVKGTISGSEVTFEKQYLGLDSKTLFHVYYLPVTTEWVDYGDYSDIVARLTNKPLEYDYDESSGTLRTVYDFVINNGKYQPVTDYLYPASVFAPWEDKAYTPQTPEIVNLEDNRKQLGRVVLSFEMPEIDPEGNVLDQDKYYYRLYIDNADQLYTFTADKYKNLDEDITDVPFSFADNYDFYANHSFHIAYVYNNDQLTNATRIGVQSVYKGGGETRTSEISWHDASAVNAIQTTPLAVRNVVYTDLSGRQILNPESGIYVKTTTFADGTKKSIKIVK